MISLARYSELLAEREIKHAFIASLLGRLPIGMTGLALMLLSQSRGDSFAYTGLLTGAYVAGLAIASPFLGRLIDRIGPRPVLSLCGAVHPFALLGILGAVLVDLPPWLTIAIAAGAGATLPPITVCLRALLRHHLGSGSMLVAALSLDSVIIEIVFIAGPLLVALLVAIFNASVAVAVAAASAGLGVASFLRAPVMADWIATGAPPGALLGPLSDSRLLVLLGVAVCYSCVFGLVEIGVTAYAVDAQRPALAGVMLGAMSIGSALSGITYGSRNWHQPLARQFTVSLALMGVAIVPLALAPGALGFGVLSLLAGLTMAPPLIIQSTLVAQVVRVEHITEGFTWSVTALLVGVGIGLAGGGVLLDYGGIGPVFFGAAAVSAAAALFATLTTRDAQITT